MKEMGGRIEFRRLPSAQQAFAGYPYRLEIGESARYRPGFDPSKDEKQHRQLNNHQGGEGPPVFAPSFGKFAQKQSPSTESFQSL
jgi:hypothetical protein